MTRLAGPTRLIALALLAAASLVAAGLLASDGPAESASADRDESTIIVKFKPSADPERAIAEEGDRTGGDIPPSATLVELGPGRTVDEALVGYTARADVVYAEPNAIVRSQALVDPYDDYAVGPNPIQWALPKLRMTDAWQLYPGAYSTANNGPLVAVLDTGVLYTHTDLTSKVRTDLGANCLSGPCVASNVNPAIVTDDSPNAHGTHVAGVIAAETNNTYGMAGIAINSQIIPIKVLDSTGAGTVSQVSAGMNWAVSSGARVVYTGFTTTAASPTLCEMVNSIRIANVVVVAPTGNDGVETPNYPAACPVAIGVSATGRNDEVPAFSNYGYPNTFISAPGVEIRSTGTLNANDYPDFTGTSAAAAHVAGVVALLIGQKPTRSVADIRSLLATTADRPGDPTTYTEDPFSGTCPGCRWNTKYGFGRVNAYAALLFDAPQPPGSPPPPPPVTVVSPPTLAITAVNISRGGKFVFPYPLRVGETTLVIENKDSVARTLAVTGPGLERRTTAIPAGKSGSLKVTFKQATYHFWDPTRARIARVGPAVRKPSARKPVHVVIAANGSVKLPAKLPAGKVAFLVTNKSKALQRIVVIGPGIGKNVIVKPGKNVRTTLTLKRGGYHFWGPAGSVSSQGVYLS